MILVVYANSYEEKIKFILHMAFKNFVILLASLFTFSSCHTIKNLLGTYRSYAYGKGVFFFDVELDFKNDSTFNYRMRYDIYGDGATGNYNTRGNYINLYYNPDKIDTPINSLPSRNKNGRMSCLYFQNGKLFVCDSTGKIFREYTKYIQSPQHNNRPYKTTKAKYYFKKGKIFD